MSNPIRATTGESGRNHYRRPLTSFAERAESIYAAVPAEVREKLPPRRRADLRRSKSGSCHASLLERVAAEVCELSLAGDYGFADSALQLIRDAAIDPDQVSLPLSVEAAVLDAQRLDVAEDGAEVEAYATKFTDRAAVLRFADASAKAGRAEFLKAAALRRHAATLPEAGR